MRIANDLYVFRKFAGVNFIDEAKESVALNLRPDGSKNVFIFATNKNKVSKAF